jgi:hypothetical protein
MYVRFSARAGEHFFGGWSVYRADVHVTIVQPWSRFRGEELTSPQLAMKSVFPVAGPASCVCDCYDADSRAGDVEQNDVREPAKNTASNRRFEDWKLKRLIADPLQRGKYNLSEIRSNDRIDLKIPIVSFVDLGGS